MANLKKVLAGTLGLCMAASMLTACGDSDSSSSSDSKAAAKKGGSGISESKDRVNTAELHGKDSSEESKNTVKIYCWNTEFKSRLDTYYEKGADALPVEKDADGSITSIDGKKIEWVQIENEGNAYQTKLDEALKGQGDSDDKVDMFLMEADYALKYANGDVALSVQDLGLTADDMSEMYQYTKDVATDTATGELKGVSWQATPGLFMYNRNYAKEVLGSDDPATVQEAVKDWDAFTDTAAKMKEKGIFMVSGFDDTYRCFSNNVSAPWVDADGKVTVDPQIKAWVDQTKEYTDKGYNNKTALWSEEWGKDQSKEGKVFGFFYSTWGINFTLANNAKSNDLYYVCPGPQAYYWGGTWMCAADGTDNVETVKDIMKKLTCDAANMKKLTQETQDYTNNQTAMKELSNGFKSEFLGGQNHIALFVDAAPKIDASNAGPYDQGCNEEFQTAFHDYFSGKVDKDTATANFYKAIKVKYPNLKTPS